MYNNKELVFRQDYKKNFTPLFRIVVLNLLAVKWLERIGKTENQNPEVFSQMVSSSKYLLDHTNKKIFFDWVSNFIKAIKSDSQISVHISLQKCYTAMLGSVLNLLEPRNTHFMFPELTEKLERNALDFSSLIADLHRCHKGLLRQIASIENQVNRQISVGKKIEAALIDPITTVKLAKIFYKMVDPVVAYSADYLRSFQLPIPHFDPSLILGLGLSSLELYFSNNRTVFLSWRLKEILCSQPKLMAKIWNAADCVSNVSVNKLEAVTPHLFHRTLEYFRLDELSRITRSETLNKAIGLGTTAGVAAFLGAPIASALFTYMVSDICAETVSWLELDKKAINAFTKLTGYKVDANQANGVSTLFQMGTRLVSSNLASNLYGRLFPPESRLVKRPNPLFPSQREIELKKKQIELGLVDENGVLDELQCRIAKLKHHPDKLVGRLTSDEKSAWEAIMAIC